MRLSRWVILVLLAALTLLLLGTAVMTYRSSNPAKSTPTASSAKGLARHNERPSTMQLIAVSEESSLVILRLLNPDVERLDNTPEIAASPTTDVVPFYVHSQNRLIALYFYP